MAGNADAVAVAGGEQERNAKTGERFGDGNGGTAAEVDVQYRYIRPLRGQELERLGFGAGGDDVLDLRIGKDLLETDGNHQLVLEDQHAGIDQGCAVWQHHRRWGRWAVVA
ncbi:hypothetical protein D3C76_1091240 [compost metagenome]